MGRRQIISENLQAESLLTGTRAEPRLGQLRGTVRIGRGPSLCEPASPSRGGRRSPPFCLTTQVQIDQKNEAGVIRVAQSVLALTKRERLYF